MHLKFLLIMTLLGLIDISITPSLNTEKLKKSALFWSLLLLVYFNFSLLFFSKANEFQFNLIINWLQNFTNLKWGDLFMSIDGLSMFFMGLSMILIPICMIMSWNSIKYFKKEFLMCLFSMTIFLMGVF